MNSNNSPCSEEDLIKTSEKLLKTRNFESCRSYILNSPFYHPTNLTAIKILTLIDVLSTKSTNTRPDYYSILSLTRFTKSHRLIKTRFKTLASLLNPNTNPISLSSEAYSLVIEAYSVLSNDTEKKKFDEWLKICDNEEKKNNGFWTVCPYCYYVYEYERVYEGCILRCQNGECRRGFTGVGIKVPPPKEVAGSGKYLCLGFKENGFKGFSSWSPFCRDLEENKKEKENENGNEKEKEKEILEENGNEKQMENLEDNGNEKEKENLEESGNEKEMEKEKEKENKTGVKRRKSVGVYAKKVMGKGVRVRRVVDEVFESSEESVV